MVGKIHIARTIAPQLKGLIEQSTGRSRIPMPANITATLGCRRLATQQAQARHPAPSRTSGAPFSTRTIALTQRAIRAHSAATLAKPAHLQSFVQAIHTLYSGGALGRRVDVSKGGNLFLTSRGRALLQDVRAGFKSARWQASHREARCQQILNSCCAALSRDLQTAAGTDELRHIFKLEASDAKLAELHQEVAAGFREIWERKYEETGVLPDANELISELSARLADTLRAHEQTRNTTVRPRGGFDSEAFSPKNYLSSLARLASAASSIATSAQDALRGVISGDSHHLTESIGNIRTFVLQATFSHHFIVNIEQPFTLSASALVTSNIPAPNRPQPQPTPEARLPEESPLRPQQQSNPPQRNDAATGTERRAEAHDQPTAQTAQFRTYGVSDDGACQFRSILAVYTGQKKWLDSRSTPKEKLLEAMEQNSWGQAIQDSIKSAYATLSSFLDVPDRVKAFFQREDAAQTIYDRTIVSKDFNLYSPIGLGIAIDDHISPSEEEMEFLDALASVIATRVNESAGIATQPGQGVDAYIHSVHGNHYDVVAREGYLS